MKNLIITLALTFSILSLGAQARYLYRGATAKGNNVTYKCIHDRRVVTIYNEKNVYEDVTPKRSDGVPPGIDDMIDVADPAIIYNIFLEVFTPSERALLDNMYDLTIGYTVNSYSGNVMEVNFMFLDVSNWAKVPPDKFYRFEQKIKQRMKYILTDDYRKYNIIKTMF